MNPPILALCLFLGEQALTARAGLGRPPLHQQLCEPTPSLFQVAALDDHSALVGNPSTMEAAQAEQIPKLESASLDHQTQSEMVRPNISAG
jgi:hypothetical protein